MGPRSRIPAGDRPKKGLGILELSNSQGVVPSESIECLCKRHVSRIRPVPLVVDWIRIRTRSWSPKECEMSRYRWLSLLVWTLSGIGVGSVTLWLAVMFAGGGHGTYLPAAIFFPYTMLSTLLTRQISIPAIGLAILQFPVYGAVVGCAESGSIRWQRARLILALHVIVFVAVALSGRGDF